MLPYNFEYLKHFFITAFYTHKLTIHIYPNLCSESH